MICSDTTSSSHKCEGIEKTSRILITGANGLVGSALEQELKNQGYTNLVLMTRQLCDLKNFENVKAFFLDAKPVVVFHTAASVYGIRGNVKNRGSVFTDNILINTHVIESSRLAKVQKIIAMGTIAAYPETTLSPIKEEQIWDGPPHGSESSYAHAKRAMLAQLLAYRENYNLDYAYIISTNLYGPNDKFDSHHGHVIPSLIRKFYEAKKNGTEVEIWGDGTASRDFLYSKDMARALIMIMNQYSGPINVASGKETKIKEIVDFLTDYLEMHQKVRWNSQMPNGRKFSPIDLTYTQSIGFNPIYSTQDGLKETLEWFGPVFQQNLIRE